MRCPKCKYISFDDLSSCAKCSNDLSALAEDLQGTGTEAKVAFFLASVIQAQDFEDDTFSDSQAMSPMDDSNLSFDNSLSGTTGDTLGLDLDDSIEISTDDIAVELGDQLPIDLGEVDIPDTEAETQTSVDVSSKATGLDDINFDDDIDLNLTDQLGTASSESFDATEILDASDSLSDANIDLDLTGSFEDNVELNLGDIDLDATGMTLTTEEMDSQDSIQTDSSALDLDEDLLAELANDSISPETADSAETTTVSTTESFDFDMGEDLPALSSEEESFEDDVLAAEAETISSEDIDALLGDFDDDLGDLNTDDLGDLGTDDLDDFGDIKSSDTDTDSPSASLDFDELDVSDLVSSGHDDTSAIDLDDVDDEVDLSSLIDETPSTDDDFDLDLLDDDMPELDLVDEDT